MKKVITIIAYLLCAITASAVSFASPYKGSGRRYIHTISSAQVRSYGGSGGGIAQAPSASMGSASYRGALASSTGAVASVTMPSFVHNSSSSTPEINAVHTISTSASSIQGGVTTAQVYSHHGVLKRSNTDPGGNPGGCDCDWSIDTGSGYQCSKCGSTVSYDDYFEEHFHGGGDCPCYVPLDFNWTIALFISILATTYAIYKKKRTPEGPK